MSCSTQSGRSPNGQARWAHCPRPGPPEAHAGAAENPHAYEPAGSPGEEKASKLVSPVGAGEPALRADGVSSLSTPTSVADEARERAADPRQRHRAGDAGRAPGKHAAAAQGDLEPVALADPKSPAHLHWYPPTVELQVLAPGMARQTKDALAAGGRAGSLCPTGSGRGAIDCPVTVTWAVVWNQ
jgi:hypothetical protein